MANGETETKMERVARRADIWKTARAIMRDAGMKCSFKKVTQLADWLMLLDVEDE